MLCACSNECRIKKRHIHVPRLISEPQTLAVRQTTVSYKTKNRAGALADGECVAGIGTFSIEPQLSMQSLQFQTVT